jgi:hypothetical protein
MASAPPFKGQEFGTFHWQLSEILHRPFRYVEGCLTRISWALDRGISSWHRTASLDHLIGAREQRRRHGEAEPPWRLSE